MPLRDIFRRTKPAEEVRHTFKTPDKWSFLGTPAASGMDVSETSALALTAVYSCVRIISESICQGQCGRVFVPFVNGEIQIESSCDSGHDRAFERVQIGHESHQTIIVALVEPNERGKIPMRAP